MRDLKKDFCTCLSPHDLGCVDTLYDGECKNCEKTINYSNKKEESKLYYIIHRKLDSDGDYDGFEITPFFQSIEDCKKFHQHEKPRYYFNEKGILTINRDCVNRSYQVIYSYEKIIGFVDDERMAKEKALISKELDNVYVQYCQVSIIDDYKQQYIQNCLRKY